MDKYELTPRTANTIENLLSLSRDNWRWGDYWILVDESTVHIAKQPDGEKAEMIVTLPKGVMSRFCKWYETGKTK